jgi:hypothetical protein
VNRKSRSSAQFREPGKVRTGTGAEIEWAWELWAENKVGLAGRGTVSKAQDISSGKRTYP